MSLRRLAAALLLSITPLAAADFSGKWSGSGKPVGPILAVLKQDGGNLTGTAGPGESHQFSITSGKVEGDHLTFEVKMGGGTIRFELTGTASELKGTMRVFEDGDHSDSADIVLKRNP